MLVEEGPQKVSELSGLDDLDAGLFGSLSHTHSKRGGRKTKPPDNKTESHTQCVPSSDTLFKSQSTHHSPPTAESLAKDDTKSAVITTKPPRSTAPEKPTSTSNIIELLYLQRILLVFSLQTLMMTYSVFWLLMLKRVWTR